MADRALIVIDVQDSFRTHPLWRTISNPDIVDDVNRLVDHARAQEDLVVWVLHTEPGSGGVFDPEQGAFQLIVSVPHYSVHTLSVGSVLVLPPPSVVIGVVAGVALLAPTAMLLFRRSKA